LTIEAVPGIGALAGKPGEPLLPVRLSTDISRRLTRSEAPYARRDLNQIRYVVIHQSGSHPRLGLERIAQAHIRRGYPGIAYDYVVDVAGEIWKVNRIRSGRSRGSMSAWLATLICCRRRCHSWMQQAGSVRGWRRTWG
jgi:hypothetical protein